MIYVLLYLIMLRACLHLTMVVSTLSVTEAQVWVVANNVSWNRTTAQRLLLSAQAMDEWSRILQLHCFLLLSMQ